ncbi:enoyl-CoA hydratase [Pseudoxanthomonas kalamensis DSM 18571]|uniref:enoyl-CoA hydratase n=1 Tax=Pseudoxanthomonas kalamensis TaxID=289483 RepID=UPI001390EA2B|nr:enoyl-CoA hydratase [Pseudoxanthomonas kalamensis]KAF1711455.1 enoyl-CoA hydratase [Pseudoxanthomonas kalamensis DSM 18571]
MTAYRYLRLEVVERVGVIQMNRPQVLNAINDELMQELVSALRRCDADPEIGAIIIGGSEKAFAAGADIGAMAQYGFVEAFTGNIIDWQAIREIRKPVIAAVSGYALGGGCELALMCDLVVASETAQFGLPEVTLGIMPGAGGTQRLPRAVSKAKAMDMCLTARRMDAREAEHAGLVSRVVPPEDLHDAALEIGKTIAGKSLPSVMMIKEAINQAYESSLNDGLRFERRLFHSLFATEDQKEGMRAFEERRLPVFRNR